MVPELAAGSHTAAAVGRLERRMRARLDEGRARWNGWTWTGFLLTIPGAALIVFGLVGGNQHDDLYLYALVGAGWVLLIVALFSPAWATDVAVRRQMSAATSRLQRWGGLLSETRRLYQDARIDQDVFDNALGRMNPFLNGGAPGDLRLMVGRWLQMVGSVLTVVGLPTLAFGVFMSFYATTSDIVAIAAICTTTGGILCVTGIILLVAGGGASIAGRQALASVRDDLDLLDREMLAHARGKHRP